MTNRLDAASIASVRALLDQRFRIPQETIQPCARGRGRMAVHDGQIHTLGLPSLELRFEPRLGLDVLGEDDEARGVAIDAMHDERPSLAVRPEVVLYLI